MTIHNLSQNVVLVELHREPIMQDDLKASADIIRQRGDCDLILDFSDVDIMTSSSLAQLLRMRQMMLDCGHRLILCGVNSFTRSAFKVTGLEGIFELVDDKAAASAELQVAG
jgi:anti-anti-sigma factor